MKFKATLENSKIPLLAIDVGTGTQDIFLSGVSNNIENSPKLVLPSPTVIVAEKVKEATKKRKEICLYGSTMGGGPSTMAIKQHIKAGLNVYATSFAAKTIDDDLEKVSSIGLKIVSEGDLSKFTEKVEKIKMTDCFVAEILEVFEKFGLKIDSLNVAIAVQDHGEAPKNMSDRKFRFEHLERVLDEGNFFSQVYSGDEIPEYFTRMKSVAKDLLEMPKVKESLLLDTGTAAVLGALEDEIVAQEDPKVIVNVGNGHTLGVSIENNQIAGILEHHSGSLNVKKLDSLIVELINGTLTNDFVFNDGGHGAHIKQGLSKSPLIVATGPRRKIFDESSLEHFFATPNGDMMLSGCFGLVSAFLKKFSQD